VRTIPTAPAFSIKHAPRFPPCTCVLSRQSVPLPSLSLSVLSPGPATCESVHITASTKFSCS
jgi:hypothetical protein